MLAKGNETMKYSRLLNEIVLQEAYMLLTEISLQNLGFPQEIINQILAIPSQSVQPRKSEDPESPEDKGLSPNDFKKYVDWIGTSIKNLPMGYTQVSTAFTHAIYELSLQIGKLVSHITADMQQEYEKIPVDNRRKLDQILDSYQGKFPVGFTEAKQIASQMRVIELLKFRENLSSFFNSFLPKLDINLPEMRDKLLDQVNETISSFFIALDQLEIFRESDQAIIANGGVLFFRNELENYEAVEEEEEDRTEVKSLLDLSDYLLSKTTAYRKELEDPNKILKVRGMPKGYFWYDTGTTYCQIEAKRMGHCGSDHRGRLFSLRKNKGEGSISTPHVTISYNQDTGTVFQVKGAGNAAPIEKYWDMVVSFFKAAGVKRSAEQGEHSSDPDSFIDMNDYLKSKLPEVKFTDPLDEFMEELQEIAQRINNRLNGVDKPDAIQFVESSVDKESDSAYISTEFAYHFSVPTEALNGLAPFQLQSQMEDQLSNVLIDQVYEVFKQYDYDLYQQTTTTVQLSTFKKGDDKTIFRAILINVLGFDSDSVQGQELAVSMEKARDYQSANIDLIGDELLIRYFEEAVESLYEQGILKLPEGFENSVQELIEKMAKNPHVVVSQNGKVASLVQTRSDDYSYRYDFDSYFNDTSHDPSNPYYNRMHRFTREITEWVKNNIGTIVQNYLKEASDSVELQGELFKSGMMPFDEEVLIQNAKLVVSKGESNSIPYYDLDITFITNGKDPKQIVDMASALLFLSDNYGNFVEYMDEITNNKIEDFKSRLSRGAIKGLDPLGGLSRT